MRWLTLALLLSAQPAAADIKTVATVDTGLVVYYGHGPIAAPFEFGTDGEKIFVRFPADTSFATAGLDWVPWSLIGESEDKAIQGVSREGSLAELFSSVRSAVATEQLSGRSKAERMAELYQASGSVDSAVVGYTERGPYVLVFVRGGLPVMEIVDDVSRPVPPIALGRSEQNIARIIRHLQSGRLVIVDNGIECSVPPNMIAEVTNEFRLIRSGHPTGLIKNQEILQRFSHSPTPLSQLVRGRE